MTGASIKLTDEASPAVNQLVATAGNPSKITAAIAGYLVFSIQRRFETETDPEGNQWARLSPRTARGRRGRGIRGYDHILRDTTRLYQSIQAYSDDSTAAAGTNLEYAGIHQFGGSIRHSARSSKISFKKVRGKRGVRFVRPGTKGATEQDVVIPEFETTIKARPYLGINDEDLAEIERVAVDEWSSEVQQ